MKTEIKALYGRFRGSGMNANHAFHAAKRVSMFRELEHGDLVRIKAEPEEENYFDVYGREDSAKHQAEMERILERDGCWYLVAEYFDGLKWQRADSIGMCVYSNPLDPFENWYVPDLMGSAVDAVEANAIAANI